MNKLKLDLLAKNEYFKSIVDMVPCGAYCSKDDKSNHNDDENLTISARKAMVKRQKMNPENMHTVSQAMENEVDASTMSSQKLGLQDNSMNNSITHLQQRLKEKIADIKSQRQCKLSVSSNTDRRKSRQKVNHQQKRMQRIHRNGLNTKEAKIKIAPKMVKDNRNITNKDGKIIYSKFDFGRLIGAISPDDNQQKKKFPVGKNYKLLLSNSIQHQKEMEEMKISDPLKAENTLWKKAAAKAEGVKLKDDPVLLKKSLKRRQSMKKQSAKKWKDREQKVDEKLKKRQDRRNLNIQKKKAYKKETKRSKKRSTPGF